MKLLKSLTLLAYFIPMAQAADHVVWQTRTRSLASGTWAVAEPFDFDRIKQYATDIVSGRAEGQALTVVTFYSADMPDPWLPYLLSELSYARWRVWFDRTARDSHPAAARLLSLGRDSVLDYRDKEGRVRREVIQGQDPTQIVIAGKKFHILHVYIVPSMAGFLPTPHYVPSPDGLRLVIPVDFYLEAADGF